MSAPQVTAMTPANNDTDIVLGSPVTVTFDQAMDPTSINSSSFILYGPGQTGVVGPDQLVQNDPKIVRGREYVTGTFQFPQPNQFVFTPDTALRPDTRYTILLAGSGGLIVKNSIKSAAGVALGSSIQTTFTTGTLEQAAQPPSAPLPWADPAVQPWMRPRIDPAAITVQPITLIGNDLSQQIIITFPAGIDPSSFDPTTILTSVEPISNDPLVQVPDDLSYAVQVQGQQLIISIGNWPDPPPLPLPLPNALGDPYWEGEVDRGYEGVVLEGGTDE